MGAHRNAVTRRGAPRWDGRRPERSAAAGPAGFVTDVDGRVLSVTPAFCALVERPAEETVGLRQPYPWWPQTQRRWMQAQLGARLESAVGRTRFEADHVAPDRGTFPVTGAVSPLLDEGGEVAALLWTLEPAAEPAGTEEPADAAARAMEPTLRYLFESNVIGIIRGERDRILTANDAFLEMIGRDRSELESGGIDWPSITPPEWLEMDALAGEQMMREGASGPIEKEYLRPDGRRVAVRITGAVVDFEPFRWVSFVERIDADPAVVALLQQREKTAEQREAEFRRALENRDVIGRAKGILMARWHVDADRAFEMLRHVSMHSNRRLVEIAREVSEDPSRWRHASPSRGRQAARQRGPAEPR